MNPDINTLQAVHRPGETLEQPMTCADTALYAAKQGSRGQLQLNETPA